MPAIVTKLASCPGKVFRLPCPVLVTLPLVHKQDIDSTVVREMTTVKG